MATATRLLKNRIVLIFDFDETLGPSTTRSYFDYLDIPYDDFEARTEKRKKDLWQGPLAKADLLREYSHRQDGKVNRDTMVKFAGEFPLFDEADQLVPRLKQYVADQDEEIELEFVLLTAGFKTIPEHSPIARHFDRIYGGELHFDDNGRILSARRVISHVDKVHYIKQLVEGLDLDEASELENTYVDHNPQDNYVPMAQVIYVGDGVSDMSAFQAVERDGGVAIAIDPDRDGDWDGYDSMSRGRRVHNVAPAVYTEDSELMKSLRLALNMMVSRIQLLRHGAGE